MSPTDDLVHAIDARLIAAQEQIEQLESARTALRAIQRPAPAGTARSSRGDAAAERPATRRRATRARTGRRATKSVGVDQIETTLAASGDGLSAASVADQLGGDRPRVLALLRELESSGQVRRTGARRTTRWHLVTDEDRVAQRAAELAALN